MAHIKGEDVRGYEVEGKILCSDCMGKDALTEIVEDQILTESEMEEEDFYFCDECKKQL
jgi:uncharacterized protein with PIN domain